MFFDLSSVDAADGRRKLDQNFFTSRFELGQRSIMRQNLRIFQSGFQRNP